MDIYIHDYVGHIGQLEVARALAERGHSVCFTFCSDKSTPHGDLSAGERLPTLTIEPIGLGAAVDHENYVCRQWQDVQYGRALVRHLAGRPPKPDVVISANNPLVPQWLLARYCRRRRIPVIHWWTDVYSRAVKHGVGQRMGGVGRAIGWAYEKLEGRLLRKLQAVLAIAPKFREIADEWGVKTRRSVIPVAAPTESITPGPKCNSWSERQGVAETRNAVYSGTLGIKHHPELLYTNRK